MCSTDRAKALLEIFRQGLCYFDKVRTLTMLGDRLSYIGMSDIGHYFECPREAIAAKLKYKKDSFTDQFILQRGHWFENGVGQILANLGMNMFQQLEIDCRLNEIPVKAHMDFVLVWQKPSLAVRVLEVKSMSQMPESPYQTHELQVSAQTSLLKTCWNNPVLSLRDSNGSVLEDHVAFPEICKKQLGLSLPDDPEKVSIEGWLLCLSMKEARAYGPYVHNELMRQPINKKITEFWEVLQEVKTGSLSLNDLPYAQGFHALCPFCHVNSDCPKFKTDAIQPQWEPAISKLDDLKQSKAILDAQIKEIEAGLKYAASKFGQDSWISTEGHRFRLAAVKGRRSLDRELLRQNLSDLFDGMGIDNMDVNSFITSCERESEPGTRLYINPVN